ncbi:MULTISPECIES: hypothetical protein [Legionella]|uniref:Uncharacterized protein n=1 Tax=Legionella drozanskii LLAP-1 TaxID=1212489 RepID=A0A0W0SVU4_9GAMM|nr:MULTISPECIES: hypothetical protein [Legionella]KTC87379.1 hypothetical protein Ldro_0998 [Legionella drozanskii LLAP-1]PJE08532.1 MAG: hypothetical protein CK430_12360 [Legionella sp.]
MYSKTIEDIQNELEEIFDIKNRNQIDSKQRVLLENILIGLRTFQNTKTFTNLALIVDECEAFFFNISIELRKDWNALLDLAGLPSPLVNSRIYPAQLNQALLVLAIQKNAASLLNLQNNLDSELQSVELTPDNLALIRWARIKNLLVQDGYSGLRYLRPEYWDEFWTHGFLSLKSWVFEEGVFANTIVTFQELRTNKAVLGKWNDLNKVYFTNPSNYEVFVKEGLLFCLDGNEKLCSMNTYYREAHIADKELLLAISAEGRIFVSNCLENVGNGYNHSTFFSGKPGLFFGTIRVDQGQIVYLSNQTGHYKSTVRELLNVLRLLKQADLDLRKFHVKLSGVSGNRNAEHFLAMRGFVLRDELRLFVSPKGAILQKAIKNSNIDTVTEFFTRPGLRKYLIMEDKDGKNILQQAIDAYNPQIPDSEIVFRLIVENLDKLPRFFYRYMDNSLCDSIYYLGNADKSELKNIFENKFPGMKINY